MMKDTEVKIEDTLNVLIGNSKNLPKVLYVEDNEANIMLTGMFLKGSYDYEYVYDWESAFVQLKGQQYDILLIDINLGFGMDGIEATKKIRKIKEYENIPIVAVTAYSMPDEVENILAGGCTKVLTKPFEKKEMLALMDLLLKK